MMCSSSFIHAEGLVQYPSSSGAESAILSRSNFSPVMRSYMSMTSREVVSKCDVASKLLEM